MSEELDELAVGDSLITSETNDLSVETTRTDEHLFTTTYKDTETGELRLALQVDITTGATAIDPRHIDASYWTLVANGREYAVSELADALGSVEDPSIEVEPDEKRIRIYSDRN